MGFINIFIGSEENVRVKEGKLVVREGREGFPIEDIGCVMVDNLRTNVSVYALNELAKAGAAVIFCDEKHTPYTCLLPHSGYYRRLAVLELQSALSKPRKKRLWQMIVRRKLEGQAACLRFYGKGEEAKKLEALSAQVNSNDPDNREAEGARLYFPALFGEGFTRGEDNGVNGMLNYGYAIVRSLIARHLCARGFECAYGIFHKNRLNAFNLADDMIEPFRPVVDCFAASLPPGETNPSRKRELFRVVNLSVDSGGQMHSLSNAVERMAESLLSYYRGERDDLVMPALAGLKEHLYE